MSGKTENKKKRRSFVSMLTGALDRLPKLVGDSMPVRALCFFGCADEKIRRSAKDSFLVRKLGGASLYHKVVSPMKHRFAWSVETSRVLDFIKRFLNFFYILPIVYYGIVLFAAGLTMSGVSAAIGFMQGINLLSSAVFDLPMMIPGLVILLTSIPILLTDNEPLAHLVEHSRFGQRFLCGFLGLDSLSLRRKVDKIPSGGHLFILSLLVGVAIGVVTRYWNPFVIPMSILLLLIFLVVMSAPEAGLMLLAVLIPFLGPGKLVWLSILVLFSFAIKLLRGKRSLKLTLTDAAFLALAAVIWFECVVHNSGKDFGYMAILFLLVAVTGSHLLRSHGVADRFMRAMMFSSLVSIVALAAVIGLEYVPTWMLRDIPVIQYCEEIISNFGSRSGVGLYLFLTFPFVMTGFYLSGKMRTRLRYLLYAFLFLAAFVVSRSRAIVVGCVVMFGMYLLMRNTRHLLTLLFGALCGGVVYLFLLPDRYAEYVAKAFSGWDDNFLDGVFQFGKVFVDSAKRFFTGVGFEQAEGRNLYTLLLSALGLAGFVLFVGAMLLLVGYATVSTVRNRRSSPRLYPVMVACYTSVFGTLLIAGRLPVLDCPAVLLTFCMVCGFTMGMGRTMRKNAVLAEAVTEEDVEFSPIYTQGGDRYE